MPPSSSKRWRRLDRSSPVDGMTTRPFVPFKILARFIGRNGKRVAVTIAGFAVLLAGLAMLVLPGPGIVVILAGLAILATEYVWAQRLLRIAKEKANQAKDAILRKKAEEEGGGEGTPS